MKAGANTLEQARIRKHSDAGYSANDISRMMNINLKTVQSFMPKKRGRPKSEG